MAIYVTKPRPVKLTRGIDWIETKSTTQKIYEFVRGI